MSTTSTETIRPPQPGASQLCFKAGIPGFPRAHTFSLRPWGEEPTPFRVLESQDIVGLCFVIVDPVVFFPSYRPNFGAEVYQAVDAAGIEDVEVLVILTLHGRPEDTTANLLGPVVVHARTGRAVQAVLSSSGFDAQTPVVSR